jgi:hypothetical protein
MHRSLNLLWSVLGVGMVKNIEIVEELLPLLTQQFAV